MPTSWRIAPAIGTAKDEHKGMAMSVPSAGGADEGTAVHPLGNGRRTGWHEDSDRVGERYRNGTAWQEFRVLESWRAAWMRAGREAPHRGLVGALGLEFRQRSVVGEGEG